MDDLLKLAMSYLIDPEFYAFVGAMIAALGKIWHSGNKVTTIEKVAETLVVTNQALMKHPQYSAAEETVKGFFKEVQTEMGNHTEVRAIIKKYQNQDKADEIITKVTQPPFPHHRI